MAGWGWQRREGGEGGCGGGGSCTQREALRDQLSSETAATPGVTQHSPAATTLSLRSRSDSYLFLMLPGLWRTHALSIRWCYCSFPRPAEGEAASQAGKFFFSYSRQTRTQSRKLEMMSILLTSFESYVWIIFGPHTREEQQHQTNWAYTRKSSKC